jgi:hypothetical protein
MQLAAKGRKEILNGFHYKKDAKVELQRADVQLKDSLINPFPSFSPYAPLQVRERQQF